MEVKDYREDDFKEAFTKVFSLLDTNTQHYIVKEFIKKKDSKSLCKIIEIRTKDEISMFLYQDLFLRACTESWMDIVEILIKREVNIHYLDDEAIFIALGNNNLSLIKYLEKLGLSFDKNLGNALRIVGDNKNRELAEYILNNYFK